MNKLSAMAALRTRDSNGTFAVGKVLSAEEKRERHRLRQARWNAQNPDKRRAITAREREKNQARYETWHEARPTYKHEHKLKTMRAKAGRQKPNVCEIPGCGRSDAIHFDHCHKTGKFRGWICQGCNKALGYVKDSPERLRALADYLEKVANVTA